MQIGLYMDTLSAVPLTYPLQFQNRFSYRSSRVRASTLVDYNWSILRSGHKKLRSVLFQMFLVCMAHTKYLFCRQLALLGQASWHIHLVRNPNVSIFQMVSHFNLSEISFLNECFYTIRNIVCYRSGISLDLPFRNWVSKICNQIIMYANPCNLWYKEVSIY